MCFLPMVIQADTDCGPLSEKNRNDELTLAVQV